MKMITFLNHLRGIFNLDLKSGTVHNAIIQSLYDAFIMVDGDIELMRLEMCLSTASGVWLDYWGEFFTVYRKLNETDSAYARRIIEHVIRPKTTIPAIKDYIVEYLNDEYQTNYTNEDVSIKEPWKDIGKLSHKGLLSKDTLFYSGEYYRHAVLDISIPEKLTQELYDLVHSVKAAGVKIIWSFLNSYGIVTGFNEADWAQADYHRWTQTQTQRNTFGGLVLSNSSYNPCLSGRREIWFELITAYYWYAKMLDKQTDESILITKLDLVRMLEHYKVIETLLNVKDSGLSLDQTSLSGDKALSGELTETEQVERLITISQETLDSIKFIDDWLMLSHSGELSKESATMFEFQTSHEIFCNLYDKVKEFKAANPDYYNNLQPPLITSEHIARFYAKPHYNWLFDTPTMTQQDFYDLWEMGDDDDTLEDIFNYESTLKTRYLTFADVYQPPIVIAGSPWDWTPIMDIPWLWKSETLNNEELEEIYRTKFSNIPERTEIITELTTHPENAFTLSGRGIMSEADYKSIITFETPKIEKLTLSEGLLDVDRLTGKKGQKQVQILENEDFDGYNYLSGQETTVTKRRVVKEDFSLGELIDLEENQDVGFTNEPIQYSTRDWFQAPIQIGDFVQWLVLPHTRQLWNTKVMTNDEIRSFWESSEGQGVAPDNFKEIITADETIYQPPIVRTDTPFYWLNDHTDFDNEWLWISQTLNNGDLEQIYWFKVKDNPDAFPDMIISQWVTPTYPQYAFKLSQNGYMADPTIEITYSYTYHPDESFTLSHNSTMPDDSQIRLTYMSGSPITQTVEYVTQVDNHTPQRLSGTITYPQENITVIEKPITLGKLVELEEKQELFDYSLRQIIQSPVEIGEKALWLVTVDYNQLWNTPVLTKYEFMELWEGEKPKSFRSLGKLLKADSVLYQAPVEIDDSPYYDFLLTLDHRVLWDTPAISNERIARHWEGEPTSEYLIKLFIQTSPLEYQPPIEMSYKIEMAPVTESQNQLWNTPIMSNEDIYDTWEGEKPSIDDFQIMIMGSDTTYQPPIVQSSTPFYWVVDHTELDNDWLWNSNSLRNEDLERVYQYQYPDETDFTLGHLITLEESQPLKYSVRGDCQSIITTEDNVLWMVQMLQNKLWDTEAISNSSILSFWEGNDKPSRLKYKRHYLETESYYTLPIIIDDGIQNWVTPHQEWLWKSAALNNSDLENLYRATLKVDEPILSDILNYDETRSEFSDYSLRGNSQPTIEITPE